eukprot:gene1442-12061_t
MKQLKIFIILIFMMISLDASGTRRVPPLFSVYHKAVLAPGQYLYKRIPVHTLLTFDIDCSPVNSIDDVPCEVYLFKSESALNQWDKGQRTDSLWFDPPSRFNITTQTITYHHYVSSVNQSTNAFLLIYNNVANKASVSMEYNYRWDYSQTYWDPTILLSVLAGVTVLCCCTIYLAVLLLCIFLLRRAPKEYEPVDTEVRVF